MTQEIKIDFVRNRLLKDVEELTNITENYSYKFNLDLTKGNHQTIGNYFSKGLHYEPDVAHFLCRILDAGDIAIDVGANVGAHTLLMATLVGKTGRVISIDPSELNVNEIQENLNINLIDNVVIRQCLVGSAFLDRVDNYLLSKRLSFAQFNL